MRGPRVRLFSTEESSGDVDSCDIEILGASADFEDTGTRDDLDSAYPITSLLTLDEEESVGWQDTFNGASLSGGSSKHSPPSLMLQRSGDDDHGGEEAEQLLMRERIVASSRAAEKAARVKAWRAEKSAQRRRRRTHKRRAEQPFRNHPLHAELVATGVDDVEPLRFLLHLLDRADFTLAEQRLVLSELRRQDYEPGEYICRQGDVSDFMAVIARGTVVVRHTQRSASSAAAMTEEKETEALLGSSPHEGAASTTSVTTDVMHLYEGDHFGEVPLLTRETRVADVVASSASGTTVLKLPFDRFEVLLRAHPALRPLMNALRHKVIERLDMRRRMVGQQEMARCVYVSETTEFREIETVELSRTRDGDGLTRSMVNDYIVVCELGRGSHGKVFLVEERSTGGQFALKVVSRSHLKRQNALVFVTADEEEAASRRVTREIEVMQRLVHANVVRLEAVIDDPAVDELYIIEEYVACGALMPEDAGSHSSGSGRQPSGMAIHDELARGYLRDILRGLQYLHFQGIVHRDIKPANILISSSGVAKIGDLGSACFFSRSHAREAIEGSPGTPMFMAPEVLVGVESLTRRRRLPAGVDHETDIELLTGDEAVACEAASYRGTEADVYSVGATLFIMVFGAAPFTDSDGIDGLITAKYSPPRMPSAAFESSPQLRDLLLRFMAPLPSMRITVDGAMGHEWVTVEGADPMERISYRLMTKLSSTTGSKTSGSEKDDSAKPGGGVSVRGRGRSTGAEAATAIPLKGATANSTSARSTTERQSSSTANGGGRQSQSPILGQLLSSQFRRPVLAKKNSKAAAEEKGEKSTAQISPNLSRADRLSGGPPLAFMLPFSGLVQIAAQMSGRSSFARRYYGMTSGVGGQDEVIPPVPQRQLRPILGAVLPSFIARNSNRLCFTAFEGIEWLLEHGYAETIGEALAIGRGLQQHEIISPGEVSKFDRGRGRNGSRSSPRASSPRGVSNAPPETLESGWGDDLGRRWIFVETLEGGDNNMQARRELSGELPGDKDADEGSLLASPEKEKDGGDEGGRSSLFSLWSTRRVRSASSGNNTDAATSLLSPPLAKDAEERNARATRGSPQSDADEQHGSSGGLSTDRRDGERHDSASPVGGGVPTNRDDPAPPPPPRRRAPTSEIFVYLQSDDSVTTSSIESISTGAGVGLGANEGEEEEDDGVGGSVPRESRRGKGGGILRLSRSFLSSVVKRSSLSRQRLQREPSQELLDVISPHAIVHAEARDGDDFTESLKPLGVGWRGALLASRREV